MSSIDTRRRELNSLVRKYERRFRINQDMDWVRIRNMGSSEVSKMIKLYKNHPDYLKPEERQSAWDKYYGRKTGRKTGRKSTTKRGRSSGFKRSRSTKKRSVAKRDRSKSSGRKGPPVSATAYSVGTVKRGNDGNLWVIINAGNSKRWKRK